MYFDGIFLSKAYNISARKCHRNHVSWQWRVMRNLKENWLEAWKITSNLVNFHASSRKCDDLHFDGFLLSNLVNFHASSQKSENFHFDGLLLSKVYNNWAKKIAEELFVMTLKDEQYLKKHRVVVWKMT